MSKEDGIKSSPENITHLTRIVFQLVDTTVIALLHYCIKTDFWLYCNTWQPVLWLWYDIVQYVSQSIDGVMFSL